MIKIVIPLDGSSVAEQALLHALAISRVFPAELTLLRVIAEPDSGSSVRKDCVDFALWRHQAQAYLDALAENHTSEKLAIRTVVAEGRPAESIVQYAERENPDLLVLSRYGRGDARQFSVGGTAQKIVSNVGCSVLLLDPEKSIDPEKNYRRILVPIYDGKESDSVVAIATMIAEIHDASLLLLHVCEEPGLPKGLPATRHAKQLVDEMRRIVRRSAQERLNLLAARVPDSINVERRVLISANLSLAIESTAADYDCDLLMLYSGNRSPEYGHNHDAINHSLVQFSHNPLFILQSSGLEGFASNFRSIYLDEQSLQAG